MDAHLIQANRMAMRAVCARCGLPPVRFTPYGLILVPGPTEGGPQIAAVAHWDCLTEAEQGLAKPAP